MPEQSVTSKVHSVREWITPTTVLLGGLFGLYQFWYKDIVVPSKRPATLVLTGSLVAEGCDKGLIFVRAHVTATNKSETRIYAPAFYYIVWGVKVNRVKWSDEEFSDSIEVGRTQIDRKLGQTFYEVVGRWKMAPSQTWFEPEEASSHDDMIFVPAARYQYLQMQVGVLVAKNTSRIMSVEWRDDEAGDGTFSPVLQIKAENGIEEFNPDLPEHELWHREAAAAENILLTVSSRLSKNVDNAGVNTCN